MSLTTSVSLYCGDCLDILPTLPANSIDSVVCDPPAGIAFMNKSWDKDKGGRSQWIAWMTEVSTECLRVLKPGGHALVWALPRTSHWTATAWEDAGFELRDCIYHIFGSGFPKSKNLGNGWGSALKPAVECWWLLRKPLSEKSLEANMLVHGVAGINVDACRIGEAIPQQVGGWHHDHTMNDDGWQGGMQQTKAPQGRWPANLILDEEAARLLDEQSGERRSAGLYPATHITQNNNSIYQKGVGNTQGQLYGDSGGASRFFYCAKASKRDRDEGLEGMPKQFMATMGDGIGAREHNPEQKTAWVRNHHPTVKPTQLMRYLVRLVTPVGGTVLDPFCGSGSTGKAAMLEGFNFVGIELDAEYIEIAKRRIEAVQPVMVLA